MFEKAARIVVTAVSIATISNACTYQRLKPVPIHPPERPYCAGTWVCDSRVGETCYCLTHEQTRRWRQRNGL